MEGIIFAMFAAVFAAFIIGALVGYGMSTDEHLRQVQALIDAIGREL